MISVTHFAAADEGFLERAHVALQALSGRPGYLRGRIGRCTDDDARWVLITEWANVGSFRRALGGYEVKLPATALLADAIDAPSAFETLVDVAPGGATVFSASDRS